MSKSGSVEAVIVGLKLACTSLRVLIVGLYHQKVHSAVLAIYVSNDATIAHMSTDIVFPVYFFL